MTPPLLQVDDTGAIFPAAARVLEGLGDAEVGPFLRHFGLVSGGRLALASKVSSFSRHPLSLFYWFSFRLIIH